MKKWQKAMATALVAGVMTVGAVAGLASCSKTPEEATPVKATNVYICTVAGGIDLPDYGMTQAGFDNYVVTLAHNGLKSYG